MSSFERFLFYARKSVTGIVCTLSNSRLILQAIAAAIGYFSFTSVERQKTNGWTAEWTPLPDSEEAIKRKIQKEAWFDAIFQDIPDEEKERVTRRWTGGSYLEDKRKREQNIDKLVAELKKEREREREKKL